MGKKTGRNRENSEKNTFDLVWKYMPNLPITIFDSSTFNFQVLVEMPNHQTQMCYPLIHHNIIQYVSIKSITNNKKSYEFKIFISSFGADKTNYDSQRVTEKYELKDFWFEKREGGEKEETAKST